MDWIAFAEGFLVASFIWGIISVIVTRFSERKLNELSRRIDEIARAVKAVVKEEI